MGRDRKHYRRRRRKCYTEPKVERAVLALRIPSLGPAQRRGSRRGLRKKALLHDRKAEAMAVVGGSGGPSMCRRTRGDGRFIGTSLNACASSA